MIQAEEQKVRAPGGNGRNGRASYDLDAVLTVAVAAFNEYGYEATSMEQLASRLGTAKSAIYYYVDGKEDLLRLALERALGGLEGMLEDVLSTSGSAEERLRLALRGAVEVLVNDLPYVTLLLRVRGNTDVERDALARRRAFDHSISGLVGQASSDGRVRQDIDAGTLTRLLFGMVNSIVEWYRPGGPITKAQLADEVAAVAFDGLHRR